MKKIVVISLVFFLTVIFPRRGSSSENYLPHMDETYGTIHLDMRVRYEYGNQDSLEASDTFSIRTRLGYETPNFFGLSGLIEIENTIPFDSNSYDAYPGAQGEVGKTLIPDPRNTEINRAHLSYSKFDSVLTAGRQRIILNNSRFIGNVGWRQNEQTFDAITISNYAIKNVRLLYGYLDRAIRIFGRDADVQSQRYFQMDTHIFNILYSGCPFGNFGVYGYLIEVENSRADSGDMFGICFDGGRDLLNRFKLLYRAEYARQYDNSESLSGSFEHNYYHFRIGAEHQLFSEGIAYEVLEGDGSHGFRTPLATGHIFNGFADVFLTTPNDGLEDLYAWVGVKLPYDVSIKGIFHSFEAEDSSHDYGHEYDLVGIWKIDKHLELVAKVAEYHGNASDYSDITRFIMQIDFNY